MGRPLVGPPGLLWAGPCGPPPGPVWAGPLWAPLGPCGFPGPLWAEPLWAGPLWAPLGVGNMIIYTCQYDIYALDNLQLENLII